MPNHVLVFETSEYHMPKDLGVLLNGPTALLHGDVRGLPRTVGTFDIIAQEWRD
jgi:hypothetical protein